MSLSENATAFGELEPEDVEVPVFRGCQMEKDDEKLAASEAGHIEVCHGREVVIDQQLVPTNNVARVEKECMRVMQSAVSAGAVAAAHWRGRGEGKLADKAAVDAIKSVLNEELTIPAVFVISEGERDGSFKFEDLEWVGPEKTSETKIWLRVACDPLEGTNLCAKNQNGAICVLACSLKGEGFIQEGVDGYMDKMVFGSDLCKNLSKLFAHYPPNPFAIPIEYIAHWVADTRKKHITDVTCMILERTRNQDKIDRLRKIGVQVYLIPDGDVNAGLMALDTRHKVDFAVGIGAAAEGTIVAGAACVQEGAMFLKYCFDRFDNYVNGLRDREILIKRGIDVNHIYREHEIAQGKVFFAAAFVTDGLMPGVEFLDGGPALVHSICGRSRTHSIHREELECAYPPQPGPEFFQSLGIKQS